MAVFQIFGNLMKAGIAKLESVENITYNELTNTLEIIGYKDKTEIRKISMVWDKNSNSAVTTYYFKFRTPFEIHNDDVFDIISSIIFAQNKC